MTREEKLQKAHQMFDNRNLLTELKWQREYFKRGYISNQEELFNLWIFDECIKALEQESILDKIYTDIQKLRGCSCSCSDGIIDDVEDIIDKYKAESEV